MGGIQHLMLRVLVLFGNCIIHVDGLLDFNLIYANIIITYHSKRSYPRHVC